MTKCRLCTQGQPCGSSSRLGLRTSLPPSTVPHGSILNSLSHSGVLSSCKGMVLPKHEKWACRYQVFVCRTEPSCMAQALYCPTAWEALCSVTPASRSQPWPSPAKRAWPSSGEGKPEKRREAMGLLWSRTAPVLHRRHTCLCFPRDSKSRVCRPQTGWVLKWQDAVTSLETNVGSAPLQKKWSS